MTGPRWAALVRADIDVAGLRTWDPGLLRQSRVLVPVDVQALYVPVGDVEPYVRLPFVLTAPDGQPAEPMPAPFAAGAPRPPGVHLHWAMPGRAAARHPGDRRGEPNRLDLPPLPDRWVVLRLLAPRATRSTPQSRLGARRRHGPGRAARRLDRRAGRRRGRRSAHRRARAS